MAKPVADKQTLERILERLVPRFRPERINLFGSRARGTAQADSDYDLMMIVPESQGAEDRRGEEAYEALWGIPGAIDIVVLTPSQFERQRRFRSLLAATVAEEGVVLYAA